MTELYTLMGLSIIFTWIVFSALRFALKPLASITVSLLLVAIYMILLRQTEAMSLPIAVIAPLGAVLPAMAIHNIMQHCNVPLKRFSNSELLFFTVGLLAFLIASIGTIQFDPYRFGYYPLTGTFIAFLASLYLMMRGHWVILIGVLIGQLAWTFDISSTNIFDHISHGLIPFIAGIILLINILIPTLAKLLKRNKLAV